MGICAGGIGQPVSLPRPVSAVLTVGSSFDGEGIARGRKPPTIKIRGPRRFQPLLLSPISSPRRGRGFGPGWPAPRAGTPYVPSPPDVMTVITMAVLTIDNAKGQTYTTFRRALFAQLAGTR